MGYLVLNNLDTDLALDSTHEGVDWLRISSSQVAVLCVQLIGEAMVMLLCVHVYM